MLLYSTLTDTCKRVVLGAVLWLTVVSIFKLVL